MVTEAAQIHVGLYLAYLCFCAGAMFLYILIARRLQIIDAPNARSSHTVTTPRGGGTVFVLVPVLFSLFFLSELPSFLYFGIAVAAIGYWDDLRGVSAKIRFLVHLLASGLWIALSLDPAQSLETLSVAAALLLVFVYSINTFNFIDGINGLLGLSTLVGLAWMIVTAPASVNINTLQIAWAFALAIAAFLGFNWTPAKVFMGDVGSGFLGFLAPALFVAIYSASFANLISFLILFSPIYVDCGITLLQRLSRGENIFQAHRSHFYQRLSRRWNSHSYVSIIYGAYTALVCGQAFHHSIAEDLPIAQRLLLLCAVGTPVAFCAVFSLRKL